RQIRLGWLGDNVRRESATASLLAARFRDGNYLPGAEEVIRQATMRRMLDSGPENPDVARGMHDLAEVLLARNRLPEAMHNARRALEINSHVYGSASLEVAPDKELVARILLRQKEYESASHLAAEAIAIQSGASQPETIDLARSLGTHADALLGMNQTNAAE